MFLYNSLFCITCTVYVVIVRMYNSQPICMMLKACATFGPKGYMAPAAVQQEQHSLTVKT